MPFNWADRDTAAELAREARRFATLVRGISIDKNAPPHAEISAALQSFRRINQHLAAGKVVSLRHKVGIGKEFHKIGAALTSRTRPKR